METNYKSEIEQTRVGSLGSSDAALVCRLGRGQKLTDTDKLRLAVVKGQEEQPNFRTPAMVLGDCVEQSIYEIVRSKYPCAVSNPRHEIEGMSNYYGVRILNHIDIEIETEDKLVWYEIKASKHETEEVQRIYKEQLQWHWMILGNVARELGKTPELKLCHYHTCLTKEFKAENISIVDIKKNDQTQSEIFGGLSELREILPTFEYVRPEEMSIRMVCDDEVQSLREQAEQAIVQMDAMQKQIDTFKKALCTYMLSNGIKKIYSDAYSVTLTMPSVVTTFDSKRFKEDHPDIAEEYQKTSARTASVTIRVNNNKQ